jgi:accessory colonization factor AcfC
MTIVADLDLEVQGLDVATTFLQGGLEEEIYMKLPNDVIIGKRQAARLRKALYALKQAGRCWNDKIDAWLRHQGWKASPEDLCLYVKLDEQDQVEMLLYIYVDDSVIAAKDNESIDAFVDYLD